MKFKLIFILTALVAINMASCSGKDGEDGMDGVDGMDGIGIDGQDGANGVGFDELTQYGYITMKLEGTRPDDVVLQDSTSFKYTAITPGALADGNRVIFNGNQTAFGIQRFLSSPDDSFQQSTLGIFLSVTDLGEDSQSIDVFLGVIENYAVIGDDNKFFELDQSFDIADDSVVKSFEISNLSFDESTHHLTFSYSLTIDAAENVTGHDLTISGDVDATPLEAITN